MCIMCRFMQRDLVIAHAPWGTDKQAVSAWFYVFHNWDDFYQNQLDNLERSLNTGAIVPPRCGTHASTSVERRSFLEARRGRAPFDASQNRYTSTSSTRRA